MNDITFFVNYEKSKILNLGFGVFVIFITIKGGVFDYNQLYKEYTFPFEIILYLTASNFNVAFY